MDVILALARWLIIACLLLSMAYAAFSDLRTLLIPNWISAFVALLFLPAALLAGLGLEGLAIHYGVGLLLFAIGALLFAFNILGGGDVKLLAAASVWVGYDDLAVFLMVVAMIGGLLALLAIALRRIGWMPSFLLSLPWLGLPAAKGQPIPYGVAISLAMILGAPGLSVWPWPLL